MCTELSLLLDHSQSPPRTPEQAEEQETLPLTPAYPAPARLTAKVLFWVSNVGRNHSLARNQESTEQREHQPGERRERSRSVAKQQSQSGPARTWQAGHGGDRKVTEHLCTSSLVLLSMKFQLLIHLHNSPGGLCHDC